MSLLLNRIGWFFLGQGAPPPGLTPVQSEAIKIARVLCIVGMIYAHTWTGRTTAYVIHHSTTTHGMLRWVLTEMIGRSSVPLLGMVSGWLVASSAMKRGYWRFALDKARTILAPMVAWNVICLALVLAGVWVGWVRGPRFLGWDWAFQEIFAAWEFNDLNFQMPFLRDLFVLMLMAPLIVRLRSSWLVLLWIVVVVWTIGGWWFPLLLRPQIAVFFVLGIGARRCGLADRVAGIPLWLGAVPFVILGPVKVGLSIWGWQFGREHTEIVAAIELAMRLAAALFMWRLALALVGSRVAPAICRFERYAFLLFCSHMVGFWLFGRPVGEMLGRLDEPGYPVYLVVQPFLALVSTVLLGWGLVRLSPRLAGLLSGGRLTRA